MSKEPQTDIEAGFGKNETDRGIIVQQKSVDDLNDPLDKKLGDAHFEPMGHKKLIISLMALSLGTMISFADQTGVAVGLSDIGRDLNAEQTINWAGTASLLANTVCQVLFGRISDIFGRKKVILGCLIILMIADMACGLAKTAIQFYIFRALAGIGNGGVSSISQVILSDITTMKQRGNYQGILGASVGIGNAVGPFIMAGFQESYSWRGFYYFLAPLGLFVTIVIWYFIEDRSKQLNLVISKKEKFKKIDYAGIFFITASLTLLLVAISGGGSSYPWDSAIVIAMFCVGGACFGIFLLIEWKFAELPMVPLNLFLNPSLCVLLFANFLFGASYYGFIYYMPYYFHIVRQANTIFTSIFLLPVVLMQAMMSTISGQIISRTGHYLHCVLFGFGCWFLSCCLLRLWDVDTNYGVCAGILVIMGLGVGFTFQPSMVAAQVQAKKAQRAVVISTRNVMRSFGGAVGIAIGSTTVSNSLLSEINSGVDLPSNFILYLKENIYDSIDINGLTSRQVLLVKEMYVSAIRNYFYVLMGMMGACFVVSFFIRDRGLKCIDELEKEKNDAAKENSKEKLEGQGTGSSTAASSV